jgi:hypothetical protein
MVAPYLRNQSVSEAAEDIRMTEPFMVFAVRQEDPGTLDERVRR